MDFLNWIPALSMTSLLAFVLWLMRSVIATRLTRSVQHEFDKKMEIVRAELRKNEEVFKAELRAKDVQIEVLRSGAISALASRQAALDKRRIEAVEQLWSAVVELAPAKSASATMAMVKFETAAKITEKNPQLRKIFETVGGNLDLKQFKGANAARPFVSDMSWAIFSAYQAILLFAVMQVQFLVIGVGEDMTDAVNADAVSKVVQAVLPHQTEYLNKYGSAGFHYLLDELESRLLKELQNMLKGEEADKASIEQAAVILKESERLMETISSATAK